LSEVIPVKSDKDVMDLIFNLTKFEMQYPEWAKRNALLVINEQIVDIIRAKMEEKGYSKKISERVRAEFVTIDTDGYVEIDIISDFETDKGFDVAKMMEEGRKRYWTEPIKKKAQHWISLGVSFFSRGHWIPMRPGDYIVRDVMDDLEELAQEAMNAKTDEFINRSLFG